MGLEVEEEEEKQRGWLAYTPPPLALPLSYQDTAKWNRWESKYVSGIFVSALVLDRQRWLSQDEANKEQVEVELTDFDGGEIRGFRFGAIGTLNFKKPWVYTFFAATNAFDKGFDSDDTDDITLFDYRLDIPPARVGLRFAMARRDRQQVYAAVQSRDTDGARLR